MIPRFICRVGEEPTVPTCMLPADGCVPEGRVQGTAHEKLCEIAGRICYDSLGQKKSRNSPEYHQHIREVGHLSVVEHAYFTVCITAPSVVEALGLPVACLNRPSLYFCWEDANVGRARITLNLRHVLEWMNDPRAVKTPIARVLNLLLKQTARLIAPQIVTEADVQAAEAAIGFVDPAWTCSLVQPSSPHETHLSVLLSGSRGFCYDSDTEVLTDEGWKRWPDVRGDESFCTLNLSTDTVEYQTATAVVREQYTGAMYHVSSRMVDLLVTPNHRMVVQRHDTQKARRHEEPWQIMSASDVFGKRVKYRREGGVWKGSDGTDFVIPDVTEEVSSSNQYANFSAPRVYKGVIVNKVAFSKFLGYYLAEGSLDHTDGSGYAIVLSQNFDTPSYHDMLGVIRELGWEPDISPNSHNTKNARIRFFSRALYDYLKPLGTSLTKYIPREVKDFPAEALDALIRAHHAGDGGVPRNAWLGEAHTISRQLADDLQEAAMKAGYSATVRLVDRTAEPARYNRTAGCTFKHNYPSYVVSYTGPSRGHPLVNHNGRRHDSWVEYSGTIHCVTVPNGTLYVRRNGRPVWSGNSHEWVRHKVYSAISQRSTRYVDESESPWVHHPLIRQYLAETQEPGGLDGINAWVIEPAQRCYAEVTDRLQAWLIARGVDKFTARKQARGAARGYLGNALETELVYTASESMWEHIFRMRASEHADAEIREVAVAIWKELVPHSPYLASLFTLAPSPDGIGEVLTCVSSSH